jgi:hypothetical protein
MEDPWDADLLALLQRGEERYGREDLVTRGSLKINNSKFIILGFNTCILKSKRDQLMRDQPINNVDADDEVDSWNTEGGHECEQKEGKKKGMVLMHKLHS